MSSGHIPNSLPLPFSSYLEPANDKRSYTTYKSVPELKSTLANAVGGEQKLAELDDKPLVFTCGSGMTAAVGWLADTLVRESEGKEPRGALYDEVSFWNSMHISLLTVRAGLVGQAGRRARLRGDSQSRFRIE
jgi:thiosulfate/3-mercaptopyruvate sulfurtransferase